MKKLFPLQSSQASRSTIYSQLEMGDLERFGAGRTVRLAIAGNPGCDSSPGPPPFGGRDNNTFAAFPLQIPFPLARGIC
jgi:hypothetical protein